MSTKQANARFYYFLFSSVPPPTNFVDKVLKGFFFTALQKVKLPTEHDEVLERGVKMRQSTKLLKYR